MVVPLYISKLAKSLKDVWHRNIYSVELYGCPSLDTIKGLDYLHVLSIYCVDVGAVDAFKLGIWKITWLLLKSLIAAQYEKIQHTFYFNDSECIGWP